MSADYEIKEFTDCLNRVLQFDKERLINRSEWGVLNFEEARQDFDRIFEVVSQLKVLPLQHLPDAVLSNGKLILDRIRGLFERISQFHPRLTRTPEETRRKFIQELHTEVKELFQVALWIPYLAYQKGNVAKNIEALNKALKDAEDFASSCRQRTEERAKEIEDIITKAREVSAAAGAAAFTKDFQKAAEDMDKAAGTWLWSTGVAALVTLLSALAMWYWTERALDQGQLFQKLSTKLVVLAVLFTATVWCGKNYRAQKHLATINRHRAMSIQTLQAFSAAAADPHTKDTVLVEAARAVFGNVPTGYIEGGGGDSDVKIVELARNVLPTSDKS